METFFTPIVSKVSKSDIFAPVLEQVRKVIDTAWNMFRRFGVRSVSMDDVARELSVSKKTLYRCFRDKNDLIKCTLQTDIVHVKSQVESIQKEEVNPVKQVIKITEFISGYMKNMNPAMIYDLQKYHPEIYHEFDSVRQKTFMDNMTRNIEAGKKQGFYRHDVETKTAAVLFFCLMSQGPAAMAEAEVSGDFASFYTDVMRFNLHAVCTPKGLEEAKEFLQ